MEYGSYQLPDGSTLEIYDSSNGVEFSLRAADGSLIDSGDVQVEDKENIESILTEVLDYLDMDTDCVEDLVYNMV